MKEATSCSFSTKPTLFRIPARPPLTAPSD